MCKPGAVLSTAVREKMSAATTRHGHSRSRTHGTKNSPTYNSWYAMLRRVSNPKNVGFKDYGGRGIAVCDRWRVFENFLADMGERPAGTTLDRKSVNGDYCKDNCKWATRAEQARNTRRSALVERGGRTQTLSKRWRAGWRGEDLFRALLPGRKL